MRLRTLEARVIRLEARQGTDPLAGMTEEDLNREIEACMNTLATDHGGDIEATLSALVASSDPLDRQVAAGYAEVIETRRREREHREWAARQTAALS
jgi:hypothetical protein